MEKRYYIDGKCVLSYDDDVFSTDDDYTNIKELFIYPAVDKVYVKYYEKQLVQQVLEKTLKKNDSIFNTYCAIKELIKDALFIFIMTPSMEELKKRLENRKTESQEKILARFKTAYQEINEVTKYNYVVVNDDLENAVNKVESILISEKCRVDRIEEVFLNNSEELLHETLLDNKTFINEKK